MGKAADVVVLNVDTFQTSPVEARQVLSSILELAVDGGYLAANPARGIKVQGGQEREMLHLDAAQVRGLIDAAEELRPGSGLLVQVLAYGGLRWVEAVAIRRGRCDPLRSKLMIRESLSEVRGHLYFGPTKTHEGRSSSSRSSSATVLPPISLSTYRRSRMRLSSHPQRVNHCESRTGADECGAQLVSWRRCRTA
jgi:hypothetical protein